MGDIEEVFSAAAINMWAGFPPDHTVTGPAAGDGGGGADDAQSSMFVSAGQVEEEAAEATSAAARHYCKLIDSDVEPPIDSVWQEEEEEEGKEGRKEKK